MRQEGRGLIYKPRTPSGQLSRAGAKERRSSAMSPAEVVAMRQAAKAKAIDPLWGTELGKMHLQGEINATQLEAGRRWAQASAAHALAIGCKGVKAMNLAGSSGGAEPDPDTDEGGKIAEREAKAVERYRKAEQRLKESCRTEMEANALLLAVEVLIEDDKPLAWADKRTVIRGLDVLCEHWGLTKTRV